jgi:hypothetical protein
MRRADEACVFEKTRYLPTKLGGMPGVEVNLVSAAIDAEPDCLVSWPASEVILQPYIDPLHLHSPEARITMARPGLRLRADLGHSHIASDLIPSAVALAEP